jgi:hypothetical protein
MILYLAADLIWGTKVKATAAAVGVNARPVRSLEMLEARLADQTAEDPVRGVVLDLEKPEEALAMLACLKGTPTEGPVPRVVCWAPHVERGLMEQAKAAGADAVMTRGAFDAQLEKVLRELDGK